MMLESGKPRRFELKAPLSGMCNEWGTERKCPKRSGVGRPEEPQRTLAVLLHFPGREAMKNLRVALLPFRGSTTRASVPFGRSV